MSPSIKHPGYRASGRGCRIDRSLAVVWLWVVATGCGSQLPTVEGLVTLDGVALPSAKVVFEAPDRPMAVATTDPSGRYEVMTGSQRGMAAGAYRVAISAYATADGGTESPIPILKTPRRYNSAHTSGLTADILAGTNENVNFELETNVP